MGVHKITIKRQNSLPEDHLNNYLENDELLQDVRNSILNSLILIFALLGIPILIVMYLRYRELGGLMVLLVHIVVISLLYLMIFFRNRISFTFRASVILGLFFAGALSGLLRWGLCGIGLISFIFIGLLGTVLLGIRRGIVFLLFTTLTLIVLLVAVVSGRLVFTGDFNAYATSESAWLLAVAGSILFTMIIVSSFGRIFSLLEKRNRALGMSEELYRLVIEQSPLPIAILGPDGRYEQFNQKFIEVFGYTLEDIPDGRDWFRTVYPDDDYRREVVAAWKADLTEAGTGEVRPRTYRVKCKNGEFRDIHFLPVTLQDGKQFILYEDITEKKAAEQKIRQSEGKYRRLFDSAGDSIFIIKDDIFIDCNEKTLELFRCERKDIVGVTPYSVSPEHQPDGMESKEKAIEKISAAFEGNPQYFEWRHKRFDDTFVDVEVSLNTLTIEGEVLIQAILRDISERKAAEKAIRESEEQMRALSQKLIGAQEEERKNLAREIHDELGQKLTGLKLELATLKRKPELVDRFLENSTELLDDVNVSLSRIYNGLRPVAIDKLGLRQALIALVEMQFIRSGSTIQLDCHLDEKLECDIDGDLAISVYRVCQELFNNIIKHSGAARVSIILKKDEAGIILEVRDDGKGIATESSRGKISFGMLGMKERVRQHGGELVLESAPGSGTNVFAFFPFDDELPEEI